MANLCLPTPGPKFGYACADELGNPVATPYSSDAEGVPLVQAPLHYCGSGEPVCEDGLVSGCISDTDGAPTTYGPAPAQPAPGDVSGSSPRISRVRINRTGLAPFPYSTPKRPDQLIDLVIDNGTDPDIEVPWNAATGRFTLPAYPVAADIPTAGCGLTDDDGEWSVTPDYNVTSDQDSVFGNGTVLDAADGRVYRLNVLNQITNTSCRDQFVHAVNAKGFGVTPVTPTAQISYGVYNVTQAAVVQISQSMVFNAGWQHKDTYIYPSGPSPLAVGATAGDTLALFIEVISGEVIWVDAEFSNTTWYGS